MASGTLHLIRKFQRKLSSLVEIASDVAPVAQAAITADVAAHVAAQTAPDGSAWPATNSGEPALVNAAKRLQQQIVASPDAVVLVFWCEFPEAIHHSGRARGRKVRQILPSDESELSPDIQAVFADAVQQAFERRMGAA